MNSLREVKSQFKFLSETLQDFGTIPIFKRTFSQDLDLLEQHLTTDILSQTDCNTTLTKLRTTFVTAFNSEFKERIKKYTRFDDQSFNDSMIHHMDFIEKYMLETILHQQEIQQFDSAVQQIPSFEHGFKRAFMSLFGQDNDTFTSMMLLNVDQLQQQLDKDEFQEDGFMAAFWIHYSNTWLKQYIVQESEIDTGKAVYADLVDTESIRTDSTVQDERSRSGNDTNADDADIRPIYDEEPMAEYPEQCQVKSPMLDSSRDNQTTEYSKQSLESNTIEQTTSLLANNADLKAQIQEKVFAIDALKNELRKLKGNSIDTKFAKTSVLGKPVLQSLRNQSVVRQPNAFKSERPPMSKPRFASQVDVNNNLSKPVTQQYFPKRRASTFAKPNPMIASSSSRNSSKNMPRFSLNDMVHNYYLEEARKKTQERSRNSKSNEVNSHAKIQSHKTRNSNKPVDQKSHTQKPGRQIFKGHRFSHNKTYVVYEKTSPRYDLRWKPTGRILKTIGLSAGTSIYVQKKQSIDLSAADLIVMSLMIELESLFGPLFDEYFNGENQVVSKSFDVTAADASDKRQQQPDSTSSTLTLATTLSADGNFDL
ncbi:hypothetical protein Tco_0060060 [Tanacetum coccineum]